MKHNILKFILGSFLLTLAFQLAEAQSVARTGYFLENSTHKHLLNPALVPTRGYVSYPIIGSVDFDTQSNLKLTNFIFPGLTEDGPLLTFMNENVTPEQVLSQLNPENYFKLNQRLSLVSFGFYTGTTFWTFEVASKINAKINLPYALFDFLKTGMTSSEGNYYDIKDLTFNAGVLAETSVGSSFAITDKIRVGAKAKLLIGGANVVAGIDQMTIEMKPDKWTVNSTGLINLYGAGFDFTTDEDGVIDGFNFASPNMAGLGFGLDLGASWKPYDFLEVSAGITDLGVISWNKNYNRVARSSGSMVYEGIDNIGVGGDDGEGDSAGDQMNDIIDGMLELAQFKPVNESENYSESLVPTLNIGAEAALPMYNKLTFGLLYSNRFDPVNNISELTGVLNFKPFTALNLAASYTLLNGMAESLGFALGANIGIANIFLACDYIPLRVTPQYIPLTRATTHLQLGFSVSLGKMKVKD